MGGTVEKNGYPDMGNGRYSEKWTYDQWVLYNNLQRIHYNYLEIVTAMLVWILISLVSQPLAAAIIGYVFVIGRIIYARGYSKSANRRALGAYIADAAIVALFVLSLVSIGQWPNLN